MRFVCISDLRKAVIDMYGQSLQVRNCMHRLGIPTDRFSSVPRKRLRGVIKAHSVLSSKATLSSYIIKAECWETTENTQHLKSFSNDRRDSLHRIQWGEPITRRNAINKVTGDCVVKSGTIFKVIPISSPGFNR